MGSIHQLYQKDPEQLAEEFLQNAPAKIVACHGFGHAFPKPTDRKSRKHFRLEKDADGYSQLNMTCRDCGMVRYVIAEPGAVIELPAQKYGYLPPVGYKPPKGTGKFLPRRRYANEAMRRYYEELEHPTAGEEMPRFVEPQYGEGAHSS